MTQPSATQSRLQRYTFEKVGDGYQFTTTTDGLWVMAKDVERLERELTEAKDNEASAWLSQVEWQRRAEKAESAPSETRTPLAWAVESSHSGDVNVLEIFDDEHVAKLHAENNGGIVHPLYKAARVSATRTPDQKRLLDLVDRGLKIFMMAVPDGEGLTKESYNPIQAWCAEAVTALNWRCPHCGLLNCCGACAEIGL